MKWLGCVVSYCCFTQTSLKLCCQGTQRCIHSWRHSLSPNCRQIGSSTTVTDVLNCSLLSCRLLGRFPPNLNLCTTDMTTIDDDHFLTLPETANRNQSDWGGIEFTHVSRADLWSPHLVNSPNYCRKLILSVSLITEWTESLKSDDDVDKPNDRNDDTSL